MKICDFILFLKVHLFTLVGTFGKRKKMLILWVSKNNMWCKDKEIWQGALSKMIICDFILLL